MSSEANPNPAIGNDDFDNPWKEAVEHYLDEFMAFFFPAAHAGIDWSQDYHFLDQELRQVVREAEQGKRYLDKLVSVRRHGGDEGWVYIHVEIQGGSETTFAQRMFTYHYRLFDRYARPIASLAVLADESRKWRPEGYGYELFGCRMQLDFPVAKLLDWEKEVESLLTQENAFALVTAAHLLTRKTRNDPHARYQAKWRLLRLLLERQWSRQRITDLLAIIDWMMQLPLELDEQFQYDWEKYEEEQKMPYEISCIKRARQQGMQQGVQHGMQRGEAAVLLRLLEKKYGSNFTAASRQKVERADSETLLTWSDRILTADTIDKVFH